MLERIKSEGIVRSILRKAAIPECGEGDIPYIPPEDENRLGEVCERDAP